jgi:predicted AAA+ superfamily ATPase
MFERTVQARIAASKRSVLLLGARQVGKSTLARALGPELIINLADEAAFLTYAKDPGRLGREVRALGHASLVLVDEVQRVPSLLNTVQALMDEGSRHRFILTGSSARKLRRGGANLLPGRVVLEYLDPLSLWELGEAFDLDLALRMGSLPGIVSDPDDAEAILETYATVYLREEVQAEAVVRDIGAYARFLDVAAEQSGTWVNYSKLASDMEIPKETVRRFFGILEDTLLAFRIEPFRPHASRRRVSQRDRFVLFDIGVRNALLGLHRQAPAGTERGVLFEQWIILQCLYFIRSRRLPWRVSAYRTDAGAEVDVIVDTGRELLAIECKLGRNVRAQDLGGLRSFMEIARAPVRAVVLYQGERRQQLGDDVIAVPFVEFLRDDLPALGRTVER